MPKTIPLIPTQRGRRVRADVECAIAARIIVAEEDAGPHLFTADEIVTLIQRHSGMEIKVTGEFSASGVPTYFGECVGCACVLPIPKQLTREV